MGLNIKRAIKEHGLEVKEVAKRMNITAVGLSQHINGNPSVEVLERIAASIGCDISELFESPVKPEKTSLVALIKHGNNFYSASSVKELEMIVDTIKDKINNLD